MKTQLCTMRHYILICIMTENASRNQLDSEYTKVNIVRNYSKAILYSVHFEGHCGETQMPLICHYRNQLSQIIF